MRLGGNAMRHLQIVTTTTPLLAALGGKTAGWPGEA